MSLPARDRKWNKIEHRLICHISQNWRGRPLISYEVIINSIAATTTTTGLKVFARLDQRDYPKQVQVTDKEIAAVKPHPRPVPPRVELHNRAIHNTQPRTLFTYGP